MTAQAGPAAAPPHRRPRIIRSGPLARYSRFVGVMKVLLPGLAAVLLGLVAAWPKLTQDADRFQISYARLSPKEVETLSMVNARYFGVDASNRPFAVTADQAAQARGTTDVVNLTLPKADFTSSSGANVFVDAQRGVYNQTTRMLELEGGVNLFHDTGYELHTDRAVVDLGRNAARSDSPVQGHGPQGRIQAEGFEIRDRGQEVVFTGKAALRLRAVTKGK